MSTTALSPLFLKTAEDLRQRLATLSHPEARAMAAEAEAFVHTFRGWLTTRPSDAVRTEGITRLFDLNRRAMELLAHHGPPSSRRRGAEDDDEDS